MPSDHVVKNSAFVSYSRRDIDFVRQLVEAFKAHGRDVWVDWEDIPPTADWRQEIQDGIDSADDFIFVISPDSVSSEVCSEELARAIEHNKRLVPVLYRDVQDYKAIHEKLSSHNWIIFKDRDFDTVFKNLIAALDTDLDHTRAHTRLLTRAIEWDRKGRSASLLLRGQDLEEYANWWAQSTNKVPAPTALQVAYITASRQAVDARRRLMLTLMSVGLVVAVTLTIIAVYQTIQANEARNFAEAQQARAEREQANAQSLLLSDNASRAFVLEFDDHLGLVLAMAANRVGDPPAQSQRVLSEIAYSPGLRQHLAGHTKQISEVDISPDGRFGLSGSVDGSSVFFEIESGRELQRYINPDLMPVQSVALNPVDPQIAAAGLLDWSIVIWNTSTGEEIRRLGGIRTDHGHRGSVEALDISPDGQRLLSGSTDGTLILWNLETGEIIRVFGDENADARHAGTVNAVAFNHNATFAASGSADNRVIVWNIATGRGVAFPVRHRGPIHDIAYSANGARLLTASQDATAIEWNARNGQVLQVLGGTADISGHNAPIRGVVYNPDNTEIISASDDGYIIIWHAASGAPIHYLREIDLRSTPRSIALTRDGRRLLSGASQGTLSVWDVTNEAISQYFIDGHLAAITAVDYSPDDEYVVTVSQDFSGIVWRVSDGDIRYNLDGHQGRLNTVRYSADGELIATGADDGLMILWSMASGAEVRRIQASATAGVTVLAFTQDGCCLIAALDDGTLGLWDIESGELIRTYTGHERRVLSLDVSPDGRRFASGSVDGRIIIWEIESGAVVRDNFGLVYRSGLTSRVLSLAYSPDGTTLLAGALDGTINQWDAQTGASLVRFQSGDQSVWSLRYSPDGLYVVSGDSAGSVTLWDAQTGEALRRFREHNGAVQGVAFNSDGRRVLSGARDGIALLWDMPTLEDLLNWTENNRYIIALDCVEQSRYRIVSAECASQSEDETVALADLDENPAEATVTGVSDAVEDEGNTE